MKRNVFVVMFMSLMIGCGVDVREADTEPSPQVSTSDDALSAPADQICLSHCLQDCGAVCSVGSSKPACIAECRAENEECKEMCAGQ